MSRWLEEPSAAAGGEAAGRLGEGRSDEGYGPVDVQGFQLVECGCAQVRGHSDDELRRVAPRGSPRHSGYLEEAGQVGPSWQVDAVGCPASQVGHLRPEAPDDDRR